MNNQELRALATEIAGHIAEVLGWEADASAHEQIVTLIVGGVRPLIPDSFERAALTKLFAAARQVANGGTIDHDQYICTAEQGSALRAALWGHDALMEQRDREEQEAGEAAEEEERDA